ncbi:MAG: hypothetical protein ACTHLT_05845 [Devosia sp.]
MPALEGLDPNLQAFGSLVFVVAVGLFAAWSVIFGRKAPKEQTKEFALAGQLADMGPVKELVEQTGLLVQQQVRTNIHLEAVARALQAAADAYAGEIAAERNEHAIEEEVQRRFEREMERERRARRRVAPRRKPPA